MTTLYKLAIGLLLMAVLATGTLFGMERVRYAQLQSTTNHLLAENAGLHELVATERNENESLAGALQRLSDENTHLGALVAQMESAPQKVRYITRTETQLVAADPEVVYKALPAEHKYLLNNGVPVARFSVLDDTYRFETYDLSFRNTVVVGEKDTAALLQVMSSADGVWTEVPVDIQTVEVGAKYPALRPGVALGLGIASTDLVPQPVAMLPVVRVTPDLTVLSPGLMLGRDPSAALYLGSYNVGAHLPLVEDLWISAGPSTNTELEPGLSIALTTNL